ncbi:hypothetical protein MON38_10600 [Hymenobacter sp. DH14]|uniref:Uncharacterized protein n=1 Tax=Hymenobacter cyanobacteriorum TaxID=2926463 RepID=A0A9X2AHS4_9BACT|nr:hypothetical protein [Hymenobacter cyanobacteriorum]MCI1187870.1 hypothetical protein [Hymenobacter cyanobacteriorum]
MQHSVASFSKTIGRRLRQAAQAGANIQGQQMIALADGRKLWATRVPRREWPDLQPGHKLLLVRSSRKHLPDHTGIEMATVLGNHAGVESLALAWGWRPDGEADDRPATVLYYHDMATILRYELRDTGCPDVVATILPTPN